MAAKVIAISIPERMHLQVQKRAAEYASVSEYFRELIRNDQRMTQRLEQMQPQRPPQQAVREQTQQRFYHPPEISPAVRPPLASAARRRDPQDGRRS
jgi:hypothetical protein